MSNLVHRSWLEEFANTLASESYALIRGQAKVKKQAVHRDVATLFLKIFIKKVVYDSLTEMVNKEMSNATAYKVTKESFNDIKAKIQEQVSKGFEDAIFAYAKQHVEYYTTIKPVPESPSKAVN